MMWIFEEFRNSTPIGDNISLTMMSTCLGILGRWERTNISCEGWEGVDKMWGMSIGGEGWCYYALERVWEGVDKTSELSKGKEGWKCCCKWEKRVFTVPTIIPIQAHLCMTQCWALDGFTICAMFPPNLKRKSPFKLQDLALASASRVGFRPIYVTTTMCGMSKVVEYEVKYGLPTHRVSILSHMMILQNLASFFLVLVPKNLTVIISWKWGKMMCQWGFFWPHSTLAFLESFYLNVTYSLRVRVIFVSPLANPFNQLTRQTLPLGPPLLVGISAFSILNKSPEMLPCSFHFSCWDYQYHLAGAE